MQYSIYKITNKVNNKCYIGFSQNPKRRWKQHKIDSKFVNRPLYFAMRKYGIDNFEFEILYTSENRYETLVEKEPYYIELFESYQNGYNMNKGGLNTNTEKLRLLNSERMKRNNPMKILRHNKGTFKKGHIPTITKERNEKIRQSKLGKNNHNFGNPDAAQPLNVVVECEMCGRSMNKGNYFRWHGPKCRQ